MLAILQVEHGQSWWLFRNPRQVVTTNSLDDVYQSLVQVEGAVNREGLYAAGFITYEAAPAFDDALKVREKGALPLLWFGLFDKPEIVNSPISKGGYSLGEWHSSIDWPRYKNAIGRIKDHIAAGDTYQVNFTFRLRAAFSGKEMDFFSDLTDAQQQSYAAYLDIGDLIICSSSPEKFFGLNGEKLTAKPMKGTTNRGKTTPEDQERAQWLYNSQKNRAENVMIVDMIRNDMGRVSEIGTVNVSHLFDVEQYPTLWQMTSTVESRTKASIADTIAALFPCASITGAPKVRTMEIISRLEDDPRGIYTGCIGYIAPNRRAQFNVAIRTVVIDKTQGDAEYGVGGGIVWDSTANDEFNECRLKSQVLTLRRPEFQLLESLLWTPTEGCFLLDRHLNRISDSAIYFGYPLELGYLRALLLSFCQGLRARSHKVRILVDHTGKVEIDAARITERPFPRRLGLATAPIDLEDVFLYHKTTKRDIYEMARSSHPDLDDVLLWNKIGEITESSTSNVVVSLNSDALILSSGSYDLSHDGYGYLLRSSGIYIQTDRSVNRFDLFFRQASI